jgi:cysteine desulfurase
MPIYLDCNATTPVEPSVQREVLRFMAQEFGNAGSRTHEFGATAKEAVERAREMVAKVVDADREEVIFTSGATESNNLAILGLAPHGLEANKRHIVSTEIEHKAVLEPLDALSKQGFEITLVSGAADGRVCAKDVLDAVRPDTLLVSVMHVNNETGVIQPIEDIARGLTDRSVYMHVDAAQGFGKDLGQLRTKRIDLISISGHKIFAPKGIGALVVRRRNYKRPPLRPLMYGGGQERGLRAGTVPVPLAVGLGLASELAVIDHDSRVKRCLEFRSKLLSAFDCLNPELNGNLQSMLPHVVNVSFPGIDSESAILALKEIVAISNGSACTSASYKPSHVLSAMGLSDDRIKGALRWSWSHDTPDPDWPKITGLLRNLIH